MKNEDSDFCDISNAERERLKTLLEPLFHLRGLPLVPASSDQVRQFQEKARSMGVPQEVISQLSLLYSVTSGGCVFDGFDIHECDDDILYEWWEYEEIWIGQRDFYSLRWANDRFCLGDASNVSFGPEDEFASLVEMLDSAFNQWGMPRK